MFRTAEDRRTRLAAAGMARREFFAGLAYAAGGLTIAYSFPGLSSVAAWAAGDPVVETSYGRIRGFSNDGICTFRGVRYGASTAGKNRFMPPRKPEPWQGIHDATSYG